MSLYLESRIRGGMSARASFKKKGKKSPMMNSHYRDVESSKYLEQS